jgi:4-hydroxy-tetrahydrodipicolinate synthase
VTGVPITPAVIQGLLASHPRKVYGLKDSSGDESYLQALCRGYPQLRVLVGNELLAARGLTLGAAGLISGLANTWPTVVGAVWQAHQEGRDPEGAQTQLTVLTKLITGNLAPALKAALPWVSNLPFTSVRVPLRDLPPDAVSRLRAALGAQHLL